MHESSCRVDPTNTDLFSVVCIVYTCRLLVFAFFPREGADTHAGVHGKAMSMPYSQGFGFGIRLIGGCVAACGLCPLCVVAGSFSSAASWFLGAGFSSSLGGANFWGIGECAFEGQGLESRRCDSSEAGLLLCTSCFDGFVGNGHGCLLSLDDNLALACLEVLVGFRAEFFYGGHAGAVVCNAFGGACLFVVGCCLLRGLASVRAEF